MNGQTSLFSFAHNLIKHSHSLFLVEAFVRVCRRRPGGLRSVRWCLRVRGQTSRNRDASLFAHTYVGTVHQYDDDDKQQPV